MSPSSDPTACAHARHTQRSTRRLSDKGGSIVVAVLAFVVLFSFIVLAFQKEAISKIRYSGLFQHRDDLRSHAFSTMEASLAVINAFREIDGGLHNPIEGWGNPAQYINLPESDGITTTVRVIDESARLPLRTVEYETLSQAFKLLGFDQSSGQKLANTLLDWMDEDDLARGASGVDGEDYLRMRPPYRPRNAPLRTWDELELVAEWKDHFWDEDGLPLPELSRFRSLFSLDNEDSVNVNTASSEVLTVLHELGVIDAIAIETHRAGQDGIAGTTNDRPIRSRDALFFLSESQLVGVTASMLRIEVEARRGEARFLLTTLVRWRGSDPGAGQASDNIARNTAPGPRTRGETDPRGSARTSQGEASKLGYPFEIMRLTENRKM